MLLISAPVEGQRPDWRLVPELRFGQDQDLTHVRTVLPLGDGSVVVADDKNHHMYVFAPNGRYSHQIGRLGRGPGEFMRIRRAGLLRDSIWVIDGVEPRSSFFSQDGGLLTSVRNDTGVYLIGLIPGVAISLQGMVPGTPTAGREERVPLVLTSRSGVVSDTIAWLPSRHRMLVLPRPDGSYTIGQQSITDAGFAVFGTNQPALYVIDRSVAESAADARFAVVSLSPRGDTLWARSFRYAPQPYDKGDSVWAAKAPELRRRGHSDSEIRAAVFIPEFYPPVSDAVAATDGSLWLRREENRDVVRYWSSILRASSWALLSRH